MASDRTLKLFGSILDEELPLGSEDCASPGASRDGNGEALVRTARAYATLMGNSYAEAREEWIDAQQVPDK